MLSLEQQYKKNVFMDYGNNILDLNDSAAAKRKDKEKKIYRQIKNNTFRYSIIHGHFYASRYVKMFNDIQWITFVRHPQSLLLSCYHYLKRREDDAPLVQKVRSYDCFEEFIEDPWFQNIICGVLHPLSLDEFSFIGFQEKFDESLDRLSAFLCLNLNSQRSNENPEKQDYDIDGKLARKIEMLNSRDYEFYFEALKKFDGQNPEF